MLCAHARVRARACCVRAYDAGGQKVRGRARVLRARLRGAHAQACCHARCVIRAAGQRARAHRLRAHARCACTCMLREHARREGGG
eukprot:4912698-Pleurochrysis_carterae.AAC.1